MRDGNETSGRGDDRFALDDRQSAVLKSIIRQHVNTGDPVGSRTVSEGTRLNLSPASIRSIMAWLEDQGLLAQPHTSAGRVPTDRAYRLFVDRMIRRPRVAPAQADAIDHALSDRPLEIDAALSEASRQLSNLSRNVGLVLAPDISRIVVEHVEFVRLDHRRVVAILVGQSGVVHNRTLHVGDEPDQEELNRIGRFLTDEFRGMTLPEMRDRLRDRMTRDRARYDRLVADSLRLGQQAVEPDESDVEVFVEGTSNLLDLPGVTDLDATRALMRALEEKQTLIGLLSLVLDGRGVQVVIGEEHPLSDLARCSLVASTYGARGRVMGTVGIVGPTRMQYARAIGLVDHLAAVLSRILSGPGFDAG